MSDETEILETEEYPLATDHLQKGSVVSVATIERAFSVQFGTDEYEFAALRARDHIFRRLAQRGIAVHIKSDNGSLRLLTDEESEEYARSRISAAFQAICRVHDVQKRQDRALMSEETRQRHDRQCEVVGRQKQAWQREEKLPAIVPNQRQTPALVEAKGDKK